MDDSGEEVLVEFLQSGCLWPTVPLHLYAPQAVGRADDSVWQPA